ncbi:MAG: orotidine-5'-phosphate decarboxylase [Beijerinckiaceae bacterium]
MSRDTPSAAERLIVALDFADPHEAADLIVRIGPGVSFFKIGMELAYGGGLELAESLVDQGKQVFLDLKLHDIPNSVTRATRQVARLGVRFLTIHAYPQTIAAAKAGAAGSGLQLLGVTVLTSYDEQDLAAAGYGLGLRDLVARRGEQVKEAGIDGLVLSAEEVAAARKALGPDMILVTPGIRPAGAEKGDQKRVKTPYEAIAAGADYLVVGRPISEAADPRGTAQAIIAEISAALASQGR